MTEDRDDRIERATLRDEALLRQALEALKALAHYSVDLTTYHYGYPSNPEDGPEQCDCVRCSTIAAMRGAAGSDGAIQVVRVGRRQHSKKFWPDYPLAVDMLPHTDRMESSETQTKGVRNE